MSNSTRINLLFLFLVVFLLSFTARKNETPLPVAAYISHFSNFILPNTFASPPVKDFAKIQLLTQFDLDGVQKNVHYKSKQVKYRKKFKRTSNVISGLRPPIKEAPAVIFNLFAKAGYSKPHFLSHLHHFLFRLTPF